MEWLATSGRRQVFVWRLDRLQKAGPRGKARVLDVDGSKNGDPLDTMSPVLFFRFQMIEGFAGIPLKRR